MRILTIFICTAALTFVACGNEDDGGSGGSGGSAGTGGDASGCDDCIGVNIAGPGFPVDPVVSCEPEGEFNCACIAESGEFATLALEPFVGCIF